MRVHVIQHVDFEGPEAIGEWASERGHELTSGLALTQEYPALDEVGLLVVMGGPMNVYEDGRYPWLPGEREYLARAVEAAADGGPSVLGVCLGAQLVAVAAGGSVRRNAEREIGWFPVTLTETGRSSRVLSALPEVFMAGHWHGDTFDLPPHLASAASSPACANQAFETAGGHVVGIQFHLEWTPAALGLLVDRCGGELDGHGRFVQSAEQLTGDPARFQSTRDLLFGLLDRMETLRR
ncbi:MAG TPA: type 1 glutamine amidotransferase [Coriobacteriia bacterium]